MKKLASILIPAYNEKNSILDVLVKLNKVFSGKYEYEIITNNYFMIMTMDAMYIITIKSILNTWIWIWFGSYN